MIIQLKYMQLNINCGWSNGKYHLFVKWTHREASSRVSGVERLQKLQVSHFSLPPLVLQAVNWYPGRIAPKVSFVRFHGGCGVTSGAGGPCDGRLGGQLVLVGPLVTVSFIHTLSLPGVSVLKHVKLAVRVCVTVSRRGAAGGELRSGHLDVVRWRRALVVKGTPGIVGLHCVPVSMVTLWCLWRHCMGPIKCLSCSAHWNQKGHKLNKCSQECSKFSTVVPGN